MSLPAFTSTSKLAETSTTGAVIRSFNALQANLQQIFTALLRQVQLDSVLLQGLVLQGGGKPTTINHTLGRTLSGWTVVRQRAAASIYDQQDSNPSPKTSLVLVSDNPVTVDLLLF